MKMGLSLFLDFLGEHAFARLSKFVHAEPNVEGITSI